MAQDTVNGHVLPIDGNIASGGNQDISALIASARVVAAVIDSSGNLGNVTTDASVGTANTGVTAVEYGNGREHSTVLTVSQVDALTTGDNAALCDGYLLYTLPAGACIINSAYFSMGVTATTEQQGDTPEYGLGSVIGTGAVATLGTTATFEDILTAQVGLADGTAKVKTVADQLLVVETGDAHTIHFNVADTWADDTSGDLTADIAGTVVLNWTFIA